MDNLNPIIKVEGVSKSFKLPHEKVSSVKGLFVSLFQRRNKTYEMQKALQDISFEVHPGEFFGIVGRNGSGKSTLLKMLAGIYRPTNGHITVNGKLTPFIELGVGFNPELTGRENVFLNGALLGFNRKEMSRMYNEIVEFAELERFMDQKLKNYSSGMQVRLAFSIAIRAKSDILLIDEVLAVGDAIFQKKCYDYFSEIKKQGTTVVFVSHDRGSLERFCERGILIDKGVVVEHGNIKKVLKSYDKILMDQISLEQPDEAHQKKRKVEVTKDAVITKVQVSDLEGKPKTRFTYGDDAQISFSAKINKEIHNPILGVTVFDKRFGLPVFAFNTYMSGITKTGDYKKGDRIEFELKLPNGLNDGEYTVEPAIASENATVFYDQKTDGARFLIAGSNNPYSVLSATTPIKLVKK